MYYLMRRFYGSRSLWKLCQDRERGDSPFGVAKNCNYLSSTLAPSASSFAFISSASALLAASLRTVGVFSTASLASLRPRPVNSRTTLMTLIFLSPLEVRTTWNSVFSSTAAAATAAPAPATTVGVADTPNFSSNS